MGSVGNEEKYLLESLRSGKWSGRGPKTLAIEKLIKEKCNAKHAFFVTSCTSALEVSCLVAGLRPGDEVIIPSFGFVSAANAVLAAGAKPIFADIDEKTWNLSRKTVEHHITPKTKAVITVHYAGSSEGVEELKKLCNENNVFFIEDAAQSLGAYRNGQPIGATSGTLCFSLHETKNISCGEGGFVLTDNDHLAEKIEIIIEKGTNRQRFFRGQVDKYTWVERGSSYVASDLLAAIALAQIEKMEEITAKRISIEKKYREGLSKFNKSILWQSVSHEITTNGHIAGFLMDPQKRDKVLQELKDNGVMALFHYIPLHDSPYAKEHGFDPSKDLPNTRKVSESLVRLPIYFSMKDSDVEKVIQITSQVLTNNL